MRWYDPETQSFREGPWVEPTDVKAPIADKASSPSHCPQGQQPMVWAVPTQEGFALQINSMLSVLSLGFYLKRLAVLMPFVASGPHYRRDVALGKMNATVRISKLVDVNETLKRVFRKKGDDHRKEREEEDQKEFVAWADFDDVYERVPRAATCVSCAGRPPPHVRCVSGWRYAWCDRERVARKARAPKCAAQYFKHSPARRKACGACVFSVGFAVGVQRVVPEWRRMKEQLAFAPRVERAADRAMRYLGLLLQMSQKKKKKKKPEEPVYGGYCALQMRRGDKAAVLDGAGLTIDRVLKQAAARCGPLSNDDRGLKRFVATDDHSDETRAKIARAGFLLVDDAALAYAYADDDDDDDRRRLSSPRPRPGSGARSPAVTTPTGLDAYLVDILLCVRATVFVGTASKRQTSKQGDFIRALRRGRAPADGSSSSSSSPRRTEFIITGR